MQRSSRQLPQGDPVVAPKVRKPRGDPDNQPNLLAVAEDVEEQRGGHERRQRRLDDGRIRSPAASRNKWQEEEHKQDESDQTELTQRANYDVVGRARYPRVGRGGRRDDAVHCEGDREVGKADPRQRSRLEDGNPNRPDIDTPRTASAESSVGALCDKGRGSRKLHGTDDQEGGHQDEGDSLASPQAGKEEQDDDDCHAHPCSACPRENDARTARHRDGRTEDEMSAVE